MPTDQPGAEPVGNAASWFIMEELLSEAEFNLNEAARGNDGEYDRFVTADGLIAVADRRGRLRRKRLLPGGLASPRRNAFWSGNWQNAKSMS